MKKLYCPALLVAAPASGSGKTTIVAALARLHTRQGRRVRVFKCGPDFLIPHIHDIASGSPCENIDLAMCGEADLRWRLARAARSSDLILIEGVMGLYDSEPSTVELARRLGVPILLVVDAQAMASSFGAVTPLIPIAYATKLNGSGVEPIYRHKWLTASYTHLYFPSNPQALARLFLP